MIVCLIYDPLVAGASTVHRGRHAARAPRDGRNGAVSRPRPLQPIQRKDSWAWVCLFKMLEVAHLTNVTYMERLNIEQLQWINISTK